MRVISAAQRRAYVMISPVADGSAAAECIVWVRVWAYGGTKSSWSAVRVRGRGGQGGGGGGGGGRSGGGGGAGGVGRPCSPRIQIGGVTDFGKRGSEADFTFPDLPLQIKSCPSQRFYLHGSDSCVRYSEIPHLPATIFTLISLLRATARRLRLRFREHALATFLSTPTTSRS